MPARSNPFQELVTLIQEALLPHAAKVTPSALVPGSTSEALREIDILVQTSVGPYSIRIAVEAKNEARKIDATKMEMIIGKYRGRGSLLVNKIVVVSHSGFSSEAETRARDEDIELLTLAEAVRADWTRFLPRTFNVHFDPFPLGAELGPPLPAQIDPDVAINEGRLVCRCHGYDYGTPRFWMCQFLIRNVLPNPFLVQMMHDVAVNGKGKADLHFTVPVKNHVLRMNEQDYPVTTLTMRFRYVHASGAMTSKTYELHAQSGENTRFMHSHGKVGPFDVKLLLPLGEPGARGILKIEGGPPKQSMQDYKGPIWTLKDGQWVREDRE